MVNRNFLAIFFVASFCLSGATANLTDKNALPLKYLPSSIQLSSVANVSKSDATCGGLWSQDGTVCNKTKLMDHYKQENKSITEALQYAKATASVLHAFSTIINKDKIMNTSLITDSDKAIVRDWANPNTSKSLHGSGDTCWNYFRGVRSSALCYVCSGRNYKYFVKGKAIITDQECRKMVNHCQNHFHQFFKMIEASLVILKAFNNMKIASMIENLNGDLKSLAELKMKTQTLLGEQQKKIKSIVNVLNYTKTILKKDSNPEQVCSYFFRVTARPAIFIVSDIAKYAATQISPLLAQIKAIDTWSKSADSRSLIAVAEADVLFSESNLADEFKADSVILDDVTNSVSVVENANGKTLVTLTQDQKPITFVASFP